MKKTLEGKWALVTGSSRGIGRQIAIGLAELQCNVIVHGRELEHTHETLEIVQQKGVDALAVGAALDSEAGVAKLIAAVEGKEIDILYNNAAINCSSTPVFEFDQATWQKIFQVNVFAVTQLCNAFGPGMKSRNWGRIVNVSSGICDQPNLAPYSVSKAAIDKLTRDLAFEFKDTAVRVNAIDPGWIRTDLGGPDAWESVDTVLPGMLAPVLVADKGANGEYFQAQQFRFFE